MRCARCGETLAPPTRRSGGASLEQAAPGSQGLHEPWLWQPSQIGKRAPRTGTSRTGIGRRYFLVPPVGEPIKLDARPGAVLVLGRDEGCDVRFRAPSVSRRHAQIRFEGGDLRAHLSDLGTVNGTRRNGTLVSGEVLIAPKDTIRVGDVTAVYDVLEAGVSAKTLEPTPTRDLLDRTIPLVAGQDRLDLLSGQLAGDIALFPMREVLERFKALQANGTFVVEVDGLEGIASFDQGEVHQAVLGDLEGRSAFEAMADLRRGRFRFVPQARRMAPRGRPSERLNGTPPHGAATRG